MIIMILLVCFSMPGSGCIEWSEDKTIMTAEQRQEIGCAICAQKDWLEHRYRVYLWRKPDDVSADNDNTTIGGRHRPVQLRRDAA